MKKTSPLPLALLLALAACAGADNEAEAPPSEAPAPMDEGAMTTERNTVEVGLTEYEIDMPASVPAGPTTFSIRNNGSMEHSFEVEGQGVEEELAAPLQPGGTTTLDVTLLPGTYRVYCPVDDHAEAHGMELQLLARASDAATTGTAAR